MIFKIILDQNICNAKLFHSNITEINLINNFKRVFIYYLNYIYYYYISNLALLIKF